MSMLVAAPVDHFREHHLFLGQGVQAEPGKAALLEIECRVHLYQHVVTCKGKQLEIGKNRVKPED